MTAAAQSASHIPALDGVRFLAMTIVFVGHAGAPAFIPARFGVTTFFFLSGYLITTLLRREFETTGTVSLRHFYLRRLLRIFPPMWLTIAVVALLGLLGAVSRLDLLALAATAFNITNYFILGGGEVPYELNPLWSLGVEEHFYLVFPALYLAMLARGMSVRTQVTVLGVIALVVLAWRVGLQVTGSPYERLQSASDARIDSLLWGSLLAIAVNPVMDRRLTMRPAVALAIAAVSAAILLVSFRMVFRPNDFMFALSLTIQGIALLPLFYVAISHHDWPLFRWLDSKPIAYLGTISYTMYLIHLPLFALFDWYAPEANLALRGAVVYAATVAFAHLSYVWMERPLGNLRRRFHRGPSIAEVTVETPATRAAVLVHTPDARPPRPKVEESQ